MLEAFTKRDIVESQLKVAIELFLADKEYISTITLAGAVEEILGKETRKKGGLSTIERDFKLYQMFEDFFPEVEKTSKKKFISSSNLARNSFKHPQEEDSIKFDLEIEATQMLKRALANYFLLYRQEHELREQFNKKIKTLRNS